MMVLSTFTQLKIQTLNSGLVVTISSILHYTARQTHTKMWSLSKKPALFTVHTKNATILTVMICTYLEGFVSPHQDANHLCDFVF